MVNWVNEIKVIKRILESGVDLYEEKCMEQWYSELKRLAWLFRSGIGYDTKETATDMCAFATFLFAELFQFFPIRIACWIFFKDDKNIIHFTITTPNYPDIIDITYIQLEGVDRICTNALTDYPKNCQGPLIYPVKPILYDAGGMDLVRGKISNEEFKCRLLKVTSIYDKGFLAFVCGETKNTY